MDKRLPAPLVKREKKQSVSILFYYVGCGSKLNDK
jgi:hypothetical protein